MAKPKVTISIDADVLERINKIAELRGESRSETMERILKVGVGDQEEFLTEMENPMRRALYRLIMSPAVARTMAAMAGETLDASEMKALQTGLNAQAELGRQREVEKRKKPKVSGAGG